MNALIRKTDLYVRSERDHPGMWVSGRCAAPSCDNWFLARVRYAALLANPASLPQHCSAACNRRAYRHRTKAPAVAIRQAANQSKKALRASRREALQASRRICWACWTNQIADGWMVCDACYLVVERSCRGKVRHGDEESATDAADKMHARDGVRMDAYWCGLCQWWHAGTAIGRKREKQTRFTVAMFVARTPPKLLADLRVSWFESLTGWRRSRAVSTEEDAA